MFSIFFMLQIMLISVKLHKNLKKKTAGKAGIIDPFIR